MFSLARRLLYHETSEGGIPDELVDKGACDNQLVCYLVNHCRGFCISKGCKKSSRRLDHKFFGCTKMCSPSQSMNGGV